MTYDLWPVRRTSDLWPVACDDWPL